MSYSCCDFTDDVLSEFVDLGLIQEKDIEQEDPWQQFSLVKNALHTLYLAREQA